MIDLMRTKGANVQMDSCRPWRPASEIASEALVLGFFSVAAYWLCARGLGSIACFRAMVRKSGGSGRRRCNTPRRALSAYQIRPARCFHPAGRFLTRFFPASCGNRPSSHPPSATCPLYASAPYLRQEPAPSSCFYCFYPLP
jgi:hypothetical protein